jgi:hypothetical protein
VKVDGAGNVFVVGQFASSIQFGATTLSNYYFQAAFLTKLDGVGDFLWAKKAGGGVGHAGISLALDIGGNPIIVGGFTQTIDFGSTNLTTASLAGNEGFLAKYDSGGNVLSAQRVFKGLHSTSHSVAMDTNDNIYVSGYVDPAQVFVHKYDVHGNLLWEIYPAKTGSSISYGVAARRPGHLYVVTTCTGNISFDALTFTNLLGSDIFVSEISEDVPPVFTSQPTSSPPGFLGGSNYTFTTAVRSVHPVSYHWEFNGTNFLGATNASLTITNAQIPTQGSYRVIATNLFGAATSAVASLTVFYTVVVLTNGSGNVLATPMLQQSYPANTSLTLTANPATNAPFTEWTGDVTSQSNPLSLIVTNHLLLIAWFADSVTNLVLDDMDPRVTFTGSWNGQKAVGMFEASFRTAPCDSNVSAAAVFRPNITVPGYYDVSVWYRSSFSSSRRAPWSVTTQGSAITTNVNQSILGSQWVPIAPGTYFTAGSNGFITLSNNTGENSSLTVVADAVRLLPSTAPFITSGPQNQTGSAGSALTFRVFAFGTPPLNYQWQFHGTNLAGGTRSFLTIAPLHLSDAGLYRVFVSNVVGQTTSSNAMLQVTPPPPSQLYAALLNSNQLQLTIASVTGVKLSVQASSTVWDWIPIATLTNTTGTNFLMDAIDPNPAVRFYRAQWIPE